MLDPRDQELIALEVIRTLKSRFDKFPIGSENNRNAPFHEAFLQAFSDKLEGRVSNIPDLISLSSWLHGLNTSLGQSFFEEVAHILSDGCKRQFKGMTISAVQRETISEIMTSLKNGDASPNCTQENLRLFAKSALQQWDEAEIPNFSADNYIEDEDDIEAIELKTVRPNASVGFGEKQKILTAKAALKDKYPGKNVRFFIGFPFDPLHDEPTGYDKGRLIKSIVEFGKYFDPDEVLLADELWDRLSGLPNTMEQIINIINAIATTEFIGNFTLLADPSNARKEPERYLSLLNKWHLRREANLVKHSAKLDDLCAMDKRLRRVRIQPVFKETKSANGRYNETRYQKLAHAIG